MKEKQIRSEKRNWIEKRTGNRSLRLQDAQRLQEPLSEEEDGTDQTELRVGHWESAEAEGAQSADVHSLLTFTFTFEGCSSLRACIRKCIICLLNLSFFLFSFTRNLLIHHSQIMRQACFQCIYRDIKLFDPQSRGGATPEGRGRGTARIEFRDGGVFVSLTILAEKLRQPF